jgi:FlgD Ig-like domain
MRLTGPPVSSTRSRLELVLPSTGALRFVLPGAMLLLLSVVAAPAHAQEVLPDPSPAAQRAHVIALKRIEIDMLHEGASERFAEARRLAAELRAARRLARRGRARRPGTHARPDTGGDEGQLPQDDVRHARVVERSAVTSASVVPTNVRANNIASDAAGVGQAEEGMAAASGGRVLVAWNDGQGFVSGNSYKDSQGFAYSSNGGVSFTDGGVPPKPAGFPSWVWTSDPVISVNEKTGKFYYCALGSPDLTHNAVGLISGSFSGATFTWDSARVVRSELNTNYQLDKPWVAVDSLNGFVYVVMTTFDATTPANWIDFTRSTNSGRTWSAPLQISDFLTNGLVQAARPAVGLGGKLYATWQAIGDTTPVDYFKFTTSTDQGITFSPETTPVTYIANFGTGAPGYNREIGIHFPSVTVDRVGVNRGRIYLTWNESYNHLDDVFSSITAKSEVEPNGFKAAATLFTPGDILRGGFSSATDADHFKCTLAKGQAIVVWVDSLVTNETYTVRMFAPGADSLQRLCYGGDLTSNPGQPSRPTIFTFMARNPGTYTLSITPAFPTSVIGNYRIKTKFGQLGSERGRDQRDVFVTTSMDGNTWSNPVLVNNDGAGYDNYLPEVMVAADGTPYIMWRDHRDDLNGSRTHQYLSRSTDGGITWWPSAPITSAQGNFSAALSNLLPNQGDYNALAGDDRYLRAAWADGRGANVDVWTAALDTDVQFTTCPHDTTTTAGSQVWATYRVANLNTMFSNRYVYTMTSQRNWPMPTDSFSVAPGQTAAFIPRTTVPDSAKSGVNRICLNLRGSRGTKTIQCCFNVTAIKGGVDVTPAGPARFELAPAWPNPARDRARIAFAIPQSGPVSLRLFDLGGGLIRTLIDGSLSAGPHEVQWDGRDQQGRAVNAGIYFYRLQVAGQSAARHVVWVR